MNILFVDFETYYSTKDKYTLKNKKVISMTEYIRDPRFKVHGYGIGARGQEPEWHTEGGAFLRSFFTSDTILVAHNIKFDGAILKWKYGISPARYIDTQSLARAVLGDLLNGHSLKRLVDYLGLESKGALGLDGVLSPSSEEIESLASYCLTDVRICAAIYEKLAPQFPENQWQAMDWTIRSFIDPVLTLDVNALREAANDEKKRREKAILASGYAREELSSNKKFSALVSAAGIHVGTKISSRTGKETPALARTDEALKRIGDTRPELLEGRLAAKSSLLETRCEKLAKIGGTGPFPFDVQFSGATQTHRYSGGGGAGGNPQNFPRTGPIRESIVAPDGSSLVVGDFAQIEARLVAWLANEPKLKTAFSAGRDVYSEFASEIYGRKITEADKVERQFGKVCILGLGYNMGFRRFQMQCAKAPEEMGAGLVITDEEARRVVALYRTTYFNIPRLWDNAKRLLPLMETGRTNKVPFAPFLMVEKESIVLPSGLKIRYPGLRVSGMKFKKPQWVYDRFVKRYDAEEINIYGGKLVENICQGLAGEICKIAIERAESKGIKCVGQVHDEIIAVCGESETESVASELVVCMERAISWMPSLKLKSEVGHGKTWAEAKK